MTAKQMNWGLLKNGHLLTVAEREGFAVMITCDQNLVKQQNNALRRIALVVLGDTDWVKILPEVDRNSRCSRSGLDRQLCVRRNAA